MPSVRELVLEPAESRTRLLQESELLPEPRLAVLYDAFCGRFGPDVLM